MPDDLVEQYYRLASAECLERARLTPDPYAHSILLALAQKWLEMANDRFGMNTVARDQLAAATSDFNDAQLGLAHRDSQDERK